MVWIPRKKLPGEADDDAEDLPDDEVNEIDSSKIDEEIENLVSSDEDDNDVAWVQGDALGGQVQKYLCILLIPIPIRYLMCMYFIGIDS